MKTPKPKKTVGARRIKKPVLPTLLTESSEKVKVGIVGCGAIGSRIAKSLQKELKDNCVLAGLFDIDFEKAKGLAQTLGDSNIFKKSLDELFTGCDFVVEAVAAAETQAIIRRALEAQKNILAMSVGKLLNADHLFRLAQKNKCHILIPSGAIAGIDAIKAASLVNIQSVCLTTRKPPIGLAMSSLESQQAVALDKIRGETVVYEGDVDNAVKLFPKNINVAATIALACGVKDKMTVRIITSPEFKTNSHEIEVVGDFGRMVTRTDNQVCPDNPKTSYLAVLSAIETLRGYFQEVRVGT